MIPWKCCAKTIDSERWRGSERSPAKITENARISRNSIVETWIQWPTFLKHATWCIPQLSWPVPWSISDRAITSCRRWKARIFIKFGTWSLHPIRWNCYRYTRDDHIRSDYQFAECVILGWKKQRSFFVSAAMVVYNSLFLREVL